MKKLFEMFKRRWLLVLLSAVALTAGIFLALRPPTPALAVTGTTPAAGAMIPPESLKDVVVSFSRIPTDREIQTMKLLLAPNLTAEQKTVVPGAPGAVRFHIAGIPSESMNYIAVLSVGGNLSYRWEFKTSLTPGGGLGDPEKFQQIYDQDVKDYPLLLKTPYETAEYTVFYSAPKTLTVKKKTGATKTQAQMRQDVLLWIKSQGGDPTAHTIVFQ